MQDRNFLAKASKFLVHLVQLNQIFEEKHNPNTKIRDQVLSQKNSLSYMLCGSLKRVTFSLVRLFSDLKML